MSYTYKETKDHNGVDVHHYLDVRTCDYCGKGNVIRDMTKIINIGYGEHTDYSTKSFLSGGVESGMYLCDACLTIGGRLNKIKKLNQEIKDLTMKRNQIIQTLKTMVNSVIVEGENIIPPHIHDQIDEYHKKIRDMSQTIKVKEITE